MINKRPSDYLQPILVVEDNDDDFDTVVVAAQRANVRNRLVHAHSVDDARRLLALTPGSAFAFVLLDCSLPGEDGLSLLYELRQNGPYRSLPVIVLTASMNARDRNAFYAAGANAYHVKNVVFEASLSTIQHIFRYWLIDVILPTTNVLQPGKSE